MASTVKKSVFIGLLIVLLLAIAFFSTQYNKETASSVSAISPTVRIDKQQILDVKTGQIWKSLPGVEMVSLVPIKDRHYVFTSGSIYFEEGGTVVETCASAASLGLETILETVVTPMADGTLGVVITGTSSASPTGFMMITGTMDADTGCITATDITPIDDPSIPPADAVAPVVTILGDDPLMLLVGDTFVDPGVSAVDAVDGTIVPVVVSTVDTTTPGTYTVTYTVTDAAGNVAVTVRTVIVSASVPVDATAPIITLLGSDPVVLEVGTAYVEAGFVALDDTDGDLTSSVVITSTVDTSAIGTYTVTYTSTDAAGNVAVVVRTVIVVAATPLDVLAPVITILGSDPVTLAIGDSYVDAGASAVDAVDGDLSSSIVTVSTVDTAIAGTYTVTYSVSDAAGNSAVAVRTVVVSAGITSVDDVAPVITMLGTDPVIVDMGTTYTDAGATAMDDVDGDITSDIVVVSTVDTGALGTYTVTYSVSDAAGNSAVAVRTVVIIAATPVDVTAPVITILGDNPASLVAGTTYTDAGATATDDVDGDLTSAIVTVSTVDATTAGSYTVTYTVTDAAGNTAVVTRIVDVTPIPSPVDATAPIITITGLNPASVTLGDTYDDEGATATDDVDGDITSDIATVSTVDTAAIGSYTVTYSVSDAAGNSAVAVRTVDVVAVVPDPDPEPCTTAVPSTDGSSIYFISPDTTPATAPSTPPSSPLSGSGDPAFEVFTAYCTCMSDTVHSYCLPKMPDSMVYPFPLPAGVPHYAGEGYSMCGTLCGGMSLIKDYDVASEDIDCSSAVGTGSSGVYSASPSATTIATGSTPATLCSIAGFSSTVFCAAATAPAYAASLAASSPSSVYSLTTIPSGTLAYTYAATAGELSAYLATTAPFLTMDAGSLTLIAYRSPSDPSVYEASITSTCESDLTFTTLTTTTAMTRDEFLAYIADPTAPGVVVTTIHLFEGMTFLTGPAPVDSYVYMKADAGPCMSGVAFVSEPCPVPCEVTDTCPTDPVPTCSVVGSGLVMQLGTSGCVGIPASYGTFQCHSYITTTGSSATACDSATTDYGCSSIYPNQLMRMTRLCSAGCELSSGGSIAPVAGTSDCMKLGGSVDAEGFSYFTSVETGGYTSKFDDGISDVSCGSVGGVSQLLRQDAVCVPSDEPAPVPPAPTCGIAPTGTVDDLSTYGCEVLDENAQCHSYIDKVTGKTGLACDSATIDYACSPYYPNALEKGPRMCESPCTPKGLAGPVADMATSECARSLGPWWSEMFVYKRDYGIKGVTWDFSADNGAADYSCGTVGKDPTMRLKVDKPLCS